MATTIDNSDLDTLAAAVAAPYGPLTRVGDVEDTSVYPTPNSEIRVEFTSALSVTVFFSYDDLRNTAKTLHDLEVVHDWTAVVTDVKSFISGLNTLSGTITVTPYTYDNYQTLINYIRDNAPWIRGIVG